MIHVFFQILKNYWSITVTSHVSCHSGGMVSIVNIGLYFFWKITCKGKLIEDEWCIYASVNYTIICSDNSLSPGRRQAIIWNNAGLLLIGTLGTNFSEIFIEIKTFSLRNSHLKVSSAKVAAILFQPQCEICNISMDVTYNKRFCYSHLSHHHSQRPDHTTRFLGYIPHYRT